MIKIEKGRLTRYARKVDVFFGVTNRNMCNTNRECE